MNLFNTPPGNFTIYIYNMNFRKEPVTGNRCWLYFKGGHTVCSRFACWAVLQPSSGCT